MSQQWVQFVATALFAVLTSVSAFAQGASTASIAGVVVDTDAAVVPGAGVVVKNSATGEMFTTVTSGQGVFSVPSLITGTYTVTVSLEGFKTVVLNNVVVNAGVPASVRATLEVGGLTEQVVVQSKSELVQTQSATVSTTLDTRQVANLPLSSRNATTKEGNVRDLTDPLYQQYSFLVPTRSMNRYPTVRVDYQINDRHRLTYSLNFQYFGGGPDTTNNREIYFPGFPVQANQTSIRRATSGWLRSILGATLVNELRFGYGGAPVIFAQNEFTPSMWNGPVANQGGFYLNVAQAVGITSAGQGMNAGAAGTTSARDAFLRSIENTLNWQKGSHSLNFGGSLTQFELWQENQQVVPELRFAVLQGDPAESMFTPANFPGAPPPTSTTRARSTRS